MLDIQIITFNQQHQVLQKLNWTNILSLNTMVEKQGTLMKVSRSHLARSRCHVCHLALQLTKHDGSRLYTPWVINMENVNELIDMDLTFHKAR